MGKNNGIMSKIPWLMGKIQFRSSFKVIKWNWYELCWSVYVFILCKDLHVKQKKNTVTKYQQIQWNLIKADTLKVRITISLTITPSTDVFAVIPSYRKISINRTFKTRIFFLKWLSAKRKKGEERQLSRKKYTYFSPKLKLKFSCPIHSFSKLS